jgi:hypothetical protein
LKSNGLLVVVDLRVEGCSLEPCLVLADIDVLGRFEYCCLVLQVLGRYDSGEAALHWLPGRAQSGRVEVGVRSSGALRPTVVVDARLQPVVALPACVGRLALPLCLRLVRNRLFLLPVLLQLPLVLR